MRILYVTNESPIFPAGGIGTYIGYMAQAMSDAGHEVYLFTWTYDRSARIVRSWPFKPENVRLVYLDGPTIWDQFPNGPYNYAASQILAPQIIEFARENFIDVIEATDYLAPCLMAFQTIQASSAGHKVLCVSYNHGFIEDFYEADQISATIATQNEHTSERQQLRISDVVVTPSIAAKRRLAKHGITDNVTLVREPYQFKQMAVPGGISNALIYLGRISISKGIDKTILFANIVNDVIPLEAITLIGPTVNTPFREHDIKSYVLKRLKKELAEVVLFTGKLSRSHAMRFLLPGNLSPTLGSAETFSYACLETIDHGLIPIVRKGTPMEEFFPPHLSDYILDEQMQSRTEIVETVERFQKNASSVLSDLHAFNQQSLNPTEISRQMGELYDVACKRKIGFTSVHITKRAALADVTILMPAFRPNDMLLSTIDSLAAQTAGVPRVLICDDGTPDAETYWFGYAKLRLPDCEVIQQTNMGLLGARNRLISETKTKLAVFLDIDDALDPCFIERCLESYNESVFRPNAVLTHRKNFEDTDENVISHFLGDHVHFLRNDYRMSALIETDVLRRIGFDTTRRNGEGDDWVFWLAFDRLGYKASMLPESLFFYRFRDGSMSWPWSMGQTVGTNTLVKEEIERTLLSRSKSRNMVARALFSKMSER